MPPPTEANPVGWLLALLLLAAGLPFFVVTTSAPLLQAWFARTGHPSGKDPYFLYSASNLGSMFALIGYPTLVEPHLRLIDQSWLWVAGYSLLVVLTFVCGVVMRRVGQNRPEILAASAEAPEPVEAPSLFRMLRWVALAFVPSSLMLGVTTYVTTDVAAIPQLWIIPLALYLLSFILVFARLPGIVHSLFVILLVPTILVLLVPPPWNTRILGIPVAWESLKVWQSLGLHFVALFVAAMVTHGELARDRPSPVYLTTFYLCMSVGGVLGGLFNALVAPIAFNKVVEYPLVIALACLLLPSLGLPRRFTALRWADYIVMALLFLFGIGVGVGLLGKAYLTEESAERLPNPLRPHAVALAQRFNLTDRNLILQERNFFGLVRVQKADAEELFHQMVHGTTNHGMQCMELDRRHEPLTYFHEQGPIGYLFKALKEMRPTRHLAVLGVGTGTLAGYADPGWKLTFYEIDPAVVRIARDPRYFTYISDAENRQVEVSIHLGDGRLQIAKAPPGEFDILFMDAFTSDAVPIHLITKEAVELYLQKLKPDGVLVINIANRYVDFRPVLTALAEATGLQALACSDNPDYDIDKYGSHWVVLARDMKHFGKLAEYKRADDTVWFEPLQSEKRVPVWTDDFSNLLQVFYWSY
jgi:spermidine synthase